MAVSGHTVDDRDIQNTNIVICISGFDISSVLLHTKSFTSLYFIIFLRIFLEQELMVSRYVKQRIKDLSWIFIPNRPNIHKSDQMFRILRIFTLHNVLYPKIRSRYLTRMLTSYIIVKIVNSFIRMDMTQSFVYVNKKKNRNSNIIFKLPAATNRRNIINDFST